MKYRGPNHSSSASIWLLTAATSLGVATTPALIGCDSGHPPSSGSQTHFLSCDVDDDCDRLGEGFECWEGLCQAVGGGVVSSEISTSGTGGASGGAGGSETTTSNDTAGTAAGGQGASGGGGAGESAAGGSDGTTTGGGGDNGGASGAGAGGRAAAGAGSGGTTSTNDAGPICDGSDDIRFSVRLLGGLGSAIGFGHTAKYGARYVFVDGQCRYWASTDYMRGIYRGELSPDRVERLAQELLWHDLPTLQPEQGCAIADAPGHYFDNGTRDLWCTCCDAEPWASAKAAFDATLEELEAEGTAFDGPVGVVAFDSSSLNEADRVAWPLDWTIDSVATTETEWVESQAVVVVDDPQESDTLRALRLAAFDTTGFAIHVTGDQGAYFVYVADLLPDDEAAALESF